MKEVGKNDIRTLLIFKLEIIKQAIRHQLIKATEACLTLSILKHCYDYTSQYKGKQIFSKYIFGYFDLSFVLFLRKSANYKVIKLLKEEDSRTLLVIDLLSELKDGIKSFTEVCKKIFKFRMKRVTHDHAPDFILISETVAYIKCPSSLLNFLNRQCRIEGPSLNYWGVSS